jgi:hypothetical protein
MRKQELYDFIEAQYNKKLEKLKERHTQTLTQHAKHIFNKYYETIVSIDYEIEGLRKCMKHLPSGILPYNQFTSDLRQSVSRGSYKEHMEKSIIAHYSNLKECKIEDYNSAEVNEFIKDHNKLYVLYKQEKEQLDTLKYELNNVVRIFPSAKKAAEKLEELGLDLSGLESVKIENLPAIVKTSVDVCLFNEEGCK